MNRRWVRSGIQERKIFPSLKELWEYGRTILEAALIGTGIGVLPGTGASIAVFLAYERARKISRHPESFGQGAPDGILAPETANNAVTGGAMVPTLTLGIPVMDPPPCFWARSPFSACARGRCCLGTSPPLCTPSF